MKTRLYKLIFLFSLLILIMTSQVSFGESLDISPNSIKIDKLIVEIGQKADIKTFKINQLFYINNTGNNPFNDTFYIWVPDDCKIIADCCNETPNMACRYDARDEMWCFYFNETEDKNIYVGYPISNENKLSYFGQQESFTITAFSTSNSSINNDTVKLNVTVGGSYKNRDEEIFQGSGLHIKSGYEIIGITPWMSPYDSFNMTGFDKIYVFNNGTKNETIEFGINDVPKGWKVEIRSKNFSSIINNITLSPQEQVDLNIVITAPSYLAKILVEFTAQAVDDENNGRWTFTNKYFYETESVFYQILSTSPEGLETSNDLNSSHEKPYWYEEYGRFWYLASANNIQPNNESYVTISLEAKIPTNPVTININPYFYALLLIIIAIIVVIILKKIDYFKEKDIDHKMKKQTEKIEPEQKEIKDKDLSEKNLKVIKNLEKQKKKILSEIKRVEKEFKDGILDKKDYKRLRDKYKKQAVEILKEIDQRRE